MEGRNSMAKAALVIMAAGLGSRYGGVKQIAGVGPGGEILMEYSIYDAIRAGFDKVVFIVTQAILPELRAKFAPILEARGVEQAYVLQDYASLPRWFPVPEGRTKPYGTGHAVFCTREAAAEPFAVINADDYYGVEGFRAMFEALQGLKEGQAAMVGYRLKNTVSPNGTVTGGVCRVEEGLLRGVTETYKIALLPDGSIRDLAEGEPGTLLDGEGPVSMNFWGFRPEIFTRLEDYLHRFLRNLPEGDLKSECLLPAMVDEGIRAGALAVSVLYTDARWFGMTYREDHAAVAQAIGRLHRDGTYPPALWD